jgi:hypothetical protein
MLQSLGFLGLGWGADLVLFDSLYVEPPPPPADERSPEYAQWKEEYGQPANAEPFVLNLPGLRLEWFQMDGIRVVVQFLFAWAYEYAFRVFLEYVLS